MCIRDRPITNTSYSFTFTTGTLLSDFGALTTDTLNNAAGLSSATTPAFTVTSCASWGNYFISPEYIKSKNPIVFYADAYTRINLDVPFVTSDSSGPLEVGIWYLNGTEVSWLSIENNIIVGDVEEIKIYELQISVKVTTNTVKYQFQINVQNWGDSNWDKCTDKNIWVVWNEFYELENGKWTQETSTFGADSGVMGVVSVVGTTGVVGASVLLQKLNPRSTFQNLFTVAEYYQLLMTLLLLHTELPQKVYEMLDAFEAFKLDFEVIRKLLGLNEEVSIGAIDTVSSHHRFQKIDTVSYTHLPKTPKPQNP